MKGKDVSVTNTLGACDLFTVLQSNTVVLARSCYSIIGSYNGTVLDSTMEVSLFCFLSFEYCSSN